MLGAQTLHHVIEIYPKVQSLNDSFTTDSAELRPTTRRLGATEASIRSLLTK
jgi:hypothetical protein